MGKVNPEPCTALTMVTVIPALGRGICPPTLPEVQWIPRSDVARLFIEASRIFAW